jgi:ubiquinone/menaquinone biosynthesis C-methylase UbiE
MLKLASTRVLRHCSDSRISLVQANVYKLPFRRHSFDLVVCSGLIHHIDDLVIFFGQVLRVLRPGGVFLAISHRRDAPWPVRALGRIHTFWMRLRRIERDGLQRVLEGSWTRAELEEALVAAGFHRLRIRHGPVTLVLRADSDSCIE